MPQSLNARAEELSQIPEHTAAAANAQHDKGTHLSAHEETVQAEDHSHNPDEAEKLVHGKEARLAHEKQQHEKHQK